MKLWDFVEASEITSLLMHLCLCPLTPAVKAVRVKAVLYYSPGAAENPLSVLTPPVALRRFNFGDVAASVCVCVYVCIGGWVDVCVCGGGCLDVHAHMHLCACIFLSLTHTHTHLLTGISFH